MATNTPLIRARILAGRRCARAVIAVAIAALVVLGGRAGSWCGLVLAGRACFRTSLLRVGYLICLHVGTPPQDSREARCRPPLHPIVLQRPLRRSADLLWDSCCFRPLSLGCPIQAFRTGSAV